MKKLCELMGTNILNCTIKITSVSCKILWNYLYSKCLFSSALVLVLKVWILFFNMCCFYVLVSSIIKYEDLTRANYFILF